MNHLRQTPQLFAVAWILGASVMLAAPVSYGQDLDAVAREVENIETQARLLQQQAIRHENLRSPTHVEERLTDGELFYRLQDYVRASIIFTDLVDNYPQHRAFPDALFLLADSLFRAGDYLGARTRFRQLIERADDPAFRSYSERTLGRLIEIAIHIRNFDGVEGYFQRLAQLPPSEVEGATTYYRAKYLYNRAAPSEELARATGAGDTNPPAGNQPTAPGAANDAAGPRIDRGLLEQARVAFLAVPEASPYRLQALYFVGVIHTLLGDFPRAIDAFRNVHRAPATTVEHEQVSHLAHLALGRLYYETEQLDQAVEAYQEVPRTSNQFDAALYEIAWVHIRQGDSERAERALEVLTIAAPDSRFLPDAKVLRGNLLLRNGRLDDANTTFRDVARQFGPVRRELDELTQNRADAAGYFKQLVRDNLQSFDANAFLPPLAARWARVEEDTDRALTVLADLNRARTLVRETSELIDRLNAIVSSPSLVSAFPDLRSQRQTSVALRNRLSRARQSALRAEEAQIPDNPELAEIRSRRRALEEEMGDLPTNEGDFTARNERLLARYRGLSRDLSALRVSVLGVEARITAMDRYLTDTATDQTNAAGLAAARQELATQRAAVDSFRAQMDEVHLLIERARVQVGVGDYRYQRDDARRREYSELVRAEHQIAARSGTSVTARIDSLLSRVQSVEETLNGKDVAIDAAVAERTANLRRELDAETQRVDGYKTQLAQLETDAVDVVGGVTYIAFNNVRRRFYDLVLRADVGRIDVAWSRREEHRQRAEMLSRERARELQVLDDEFQEITDTSSRDQRETTTENPTPPAETPPASTGAAGGAQ